MRKLRQLWSNWVAGDSDKGSSTKHWIPISKLPSLDDLFAKKKHSTPTHTLLAHKFIQVKLGEAHNSPIVTLGNDCDGGLSKLLRVEENVLIPDFMLQTKCKLSIVLQNFPPYEVTPVEEVVPGVVSHRLRATYFVSMVKAKFQSLKGDLVCHISPTPEQRFYRLYRHRYFNLVVDLHELLPGRLFLLLKVIFLKPFPHPLDGK